MKFLNKCVRLAKESPYPVSRETAITFGSMILYALEDELEWNGLESLLKIIGSKSKERWSISKQMDERVRAYLEKGGEITEDNAKLILKQSDQIPFTPRNPKFPPEKYYRKTYELPD